MKNTRIVTSDEHRGIPEWKIEAARDAKTRAWAEAMAVERLSAALLAHVTACASGDPELPGLYAALGIARARVEALICEAKRLDNEYWTLYRANVDARLSQARSILDCLSIRMMGW